MRVYLNVPFSDKEIVKKRGAKWDANKKTWYVDDCLDNPNNLRVLMKWIPERLKKPTTSEPLVHPEFTVVQPRTPFLKKKKHR